jgi:hypothetical protein
VAARSGGSSSGGGCGGLIAVLIVIGMIVGAAISLAAVVDPFGWMPPVDVIWGDCDGDCALAHRFPGFWWHVVVNLAYTAFALFVLYGFGSTVAALREARPARYDNAAAMEAFREAHSACRGMGKTLAALAALPLLVAIA